MREISYRLFLFLARRERLDHGHAKLQRDVKQHSVSEHGEEHEEQ